MKLSRSTLVVLSLFVIVAACDSSSGSDDFVPANVLTATDVPADPPTGVDSLGRPVGANAFTFYSLRENKIIARTDSATTNWDIAVKATTILVNGGTSGPGNGAAQVLVTTMEDLTEAPSDGYTEDSASSFAIPTGSGNGWYNYEPATNQITPIAGRVIVIRCADGTYAKLRILSYYRGAPAVPDASSESRYYTFEFAHQEDGSLRFE